MSDWRDIPGYDGLYQISREGDVRSWLQHGGKYAGRRAEAPHPIKQHYNNGRYVVYLRRPNDKHYPERVLRLMVQTWFASPPPGIVPYHKNGDLADHNINNIGFVTKQKLGKMTGGKMNRKPVKRLDKRSGGWMLYPSVAAAAKANYMSESAMIRRCKGDLKKQSKENFIFLYDE